MVCGVLVPEMNRWFVLELERGISITKV